MYTPKIPLRTSTTPVHPAIMKCDIIASGVVAVARETSLSVPLVVRLEGTNVEKGKAIMADSGLTIIPADNLGDAAEKITRAVREAA